MRVYCTVASFLGALRLARAGFTFAQNSCDAGQQATVRAEMQYAADLGTASIISLGDNNGYYYNALFPLSLTGQDGFEQRVRNTYLQANALLHEDDTTSVFSITCDDTTSKCKQGYYASMTDNGRIYRMNFCNLFFNEPDQDKIQPTQTRLDNCANLDLRSAHRSRSATILHESYHTNYVMSPFGANQLTLDYAYGIGDCLNLAKGQFDRSCAKYAGRRVLCPGSDGKEGTCAREIAQKNADSFTFVGVGVGFTSLCGRQIPLPSGSSQKRRSPNANVRAIHLIKRTCNPDGDDLAMDDGPDN